MANHNYFSFNGQKYYVGTIVKLNNAAPHPYPYAKYAMYDECSGLFVAMSSTEEPYMNGRWMMPLKEKDIEYVVKQIDRNNIEYVKEYKDTECDDMFYAWFTYIVAMFFAMFLNSRILAWILFTIIFANYRHNKLYVAKTTQKLRKRKG